MTWKIYQIKIIKKNEMRHFYYRLVSYQILNQKIDDFRSSLMNYHIPKTQELIKILKKVEFLLHFEN